MTPPILWRESFGYGSADLSQVYLFIRRDPGGPNATVQDFAAGGSLLQYGRGSGGDQGFAYQNAIAVRALTLGFPGAVSSGFGVGFAYNQGGRVGSNVLCEFWDDDALGDGSFSAARLHLSIETLPNGVVCARNGNGVASGSPTIIQTSSYVLGVGSNTSGGPWTHFEVIPVISSTVGSVLVYADGVQIMNLSGVNTRNGGSGKVGYVQIGSANPAIPLVTDWYITDGSSQFGDKRVSYRHAAAGGTYTAGTATGAGSLLGCVQETVMDGDATYINFDATSLPKAASFTTNAMPSDVVNIYEVSPLVIRRKDDATAATDRLVFRSSSTEDDGGVDLATPSGYQRTSGAGPARAYALDPHTSSAWTKTNCDNAEIGDRRTA